MKRFFLFSILLIWGSAYAQQKVALVVGNNDYKEYPLKNAGNDAALMTATLKKLGFTVQQVLNASRMEFQKQMAAFNRNNKDADVRFFYYAGHGIQFDGNNYLVPVDAALEDKEDVKLEGINFSDVFSILQDSKPTAINVFVIDACRNDPFKNRSWGSRGGDDRGLVLKKTDFTTGSFAAFSADNGQKASDGEGQNGLYTQVLAQALLEPGAEINILFQRVRNKVKQQSGGAQVPVEENRLIGDNGFYFVPAAAPDKPQPTEQFKKYYYYVDQRGIKSSKQFTTEDETETFMKTSNLYGKVYSNIGEVFIIDPPVAPVTPPKPVEHNTANVQQKLAEAKKHFDDKAYNEALAIYNSLPEGDVDADGVYNLGFMYEYGHGVDKDYNKAITWFRKSADGGNVLAMANLGYIYGITLDYTQAKIWHQKAADAGNSAAMNNLGSLYQNGNGVTQDYTQAVYWFRKGADAGNYYAMANLGYMYQNGFGVDKDYSQAVSWYHKSSDGGNAVATANLGYLYLNGFGVDKDYKQAISWFSKAADENNAFAMSNLGYLYENGFGVPLNYDQAKSWYQKAADLGDSFAKDKIAKWNHTDTPVTPVVNNTGNVQQKLAEAKKYYGDKAYDKAFAIYNSLTEGDLDVDAISELGYMYGMGYGVSVDNSKAVYWYRKAANAGNFYSMANLGYMYEFGYGIDKDYSQAVYWSRKAADGGVAAGMTNLGYLYLNGFGVDKDYSQAIYWSRKGVDGGNDSAMANLGYLYENGYGITQDYNQAKSWYQKAADLGNAYAKDKIAKWNH